MLRVQYHPRVASTNTLLLESNQSVHAHLCITEYQSGGRGRRNRVWKSPFARNLAMSLGFAFTRPLNRLGGMSSVVGVALTEALHELGAETTRLKWPNDIVTEDGKLCGILTELRLHGGKSEAVIGIGVNVELSAEDEHQIDQPVTDLRRLGVQETRSELVVHLIKRVYDLVGTFSYDGFGPFVERFNALHAYHGQRCYILEGDEKTEGVVEGIAEDGALILMTGRGNKHYHGGEVSLRSSKIEPPNAK